MADYISALTGVQMDQALLDMAEHNSEAYAVGERNGIAVAPDDVTYHNNARYYAQIASSQIVGDASSAVRWDTDQSEALTSAQKAVARNNIGAASDSDVVKITSQTLTSAEQEQARANIMAGGSNPNLLDNPWFTAGDVVNQSGFSSSGTEGYTVDRWKLLRSNIVTATLGNDGMTISKSTTGYAFFAQYIGRAIDLEANYTLSVMTSDGQVYSATRKFVNGTSSETYVSIGGMNVGLGLYGKDTTPHAALYFGTSQTGSLTIKAIKLELGSVSTLANDTPPDYGEEFLKCLRYFQRIKASQTYCPIGTGLGASSSTCYVFVPLPVPLRAYPTILAVNTVAQFHIYGENGDKAISAMSVRGVSSNGVTLSTTATGVTTYGTYMLVTTDRNAYFDLSAEP